MIDDVLRVLLAENEVWRNNHRAWAAMAEQWKAERADWRQAVLGLLQERTRLALKGITEAREPSPEVAFANGVVGKDAAGLYQTLPEPEAPQPDPAPEAQAEDPDRGVPQEEDETCLP